MQLIVLLHQNQSLLEKKNPWNTNTHLVLEVCFFFHSSYFFMSKQTQSEGHDVVALSIFKQLPSFATWIEPEWPLLVWTQSGSLLRPKQVDVCLTGGGRAAHQNADRRCCSPTSRRGDSGLTHFNLFAFHLEKNNIMSLRVWAVPQKWHERKKN